MQNRVFLLNFLLVVLIVLVKTGEVSAQSEVEKHAMWTFNLAHGITWENQDAIDEFTIGIYSDKTTYDVFVELAKTRKIHDKPVNVIRYRSHRSIQPVHILFITKGENGYADIVYKDLLGKNVLTISDRIKDERLTVINFLPIGKQTKAFRINTPLAKKQKLEMTKTLLKLGGSEEVIRNLYSDSEKQLIAEQKKLEEKQKEIKQQQTKISNQLKKLKKQNTEIKDKEKLISAKESELKFKSSTLDSTKAQVVKQKRSLVQNLRILSVQKGKMAEAKKEMDAIEAKRKLAEIELKEKQEKIKERDKEIGASHKVIENQQNIIYLFIIGSAIIAVLIFLTLRAYYKKQKINKKLHSQNIAINKQKEEITSQAKQLESNNAELEKLSIVASQTDNAVTILDAEGNFEWVNAGFTRMYGYTLQLLRNELGDNIVRASDNEKIKNIFNKAGDEKETIIYENRNKTRLGDNLWVQTTLNPILNEQEELVKFITIDTDISALKKAEIEIRKKSEELMAQQEELRQQNEQIEFQNRHIRSSIQYAKTIQTAILPSRNDLNELFNSFVIFRPKDIVSGDFYWYARLPAKNGYSEKIFVAAVDCTGHGVPGAFMSLVSSRLLNEIVLEHKIVSPNEILETLDKRVNNILRQRETDNHDGMDLTLCRFEPKENGSYKAKFAGAKRPLYVHKSKENSVTEFEGTRRSIGGVLGKRVKRNFENVTFKVEKGDKLWLATDGYIDQNNAKRKRFGSPRFRKVVDEAKNLSLDKQKMFFSDRLNEYQGAELQRDDITVIGIEIK